MIRQVGLFKFLKNNYDSDEDLKDLEELVYEDENGFRNKRSINDMIHSYQVGSYTGSNHNDDLEEELYKTAGSDASADESRGLTEKTKKQQADVLKEEEKYDHLLNSIQAQTLIRRLILAERSIIRRIILKRLTRQDLQAQRLGALLKASVILWRKLQDI